MPLQDAACISIMTQTAADALFNQLGLPSKILGEDVGVDGTGVPILIWGGSSSVGVAAIQLAKAAGLGPIFVTASGRNHERLKELGADECFDYKDLDVVEKIRQAVERWGKGLKYAFDTVGSRGEKTSTEMCEECCDGDARFAGTLPVPGRPKWKMVLATRNVDIPIRRPDGSIDFMRANEVWQSRIDRTFEWCLENYGKGFKVPKVRVVKGGEEAMEAMRMVAAGKSSLEKVVIEHPL